MGRSKTSHKRSGKKHPNTSRDGGKSALRRTNTLKRVKGKLHNETQHFTTLPSEITELILSPLPVPEIHGARLISSNTASVVRDLFGLSAKLKVKTELKRLKGFLSRVEKLRIPNSPGRLLALLQFCVEHRGLFPLPRASENSLRKFVKHLFSRYPEATIDLEDEVLYWTQLGQLVVQMHLHFLQHRTVVLLRDFADQVQDLSENALDDDEIAEFYGDVDPRSHPDLLTGMIHHSETTEKAAFPEPDHMLTSIDLACGLAQAFKDGFKNPKLHEPERIEFCRILGLPELPESKLCCYYIDPMVEDPDGKIVEGVVKNLRLFMKSGEVIPPLIRTHVLRPSRFTEQRIVLTAVMDSRFAGGAMGFWQMRRRVMLEGRMDDGRRILSERRVRWRKWNAIVGNAFAGLVALGKVEDSSITPVLQLLHVYRRHSD